VGIEKLQIGKKFSKGLKWNMAQKRKSAGDD
jgi:hypothetical protein